MHPQPSTLSPLKVCHKTVSLPSVRYPSFNVAVSGSIIMYDRIAKQAPPLPFFWPHQRRCLRDVCTSPPHSPSRISQCMQRYLAHNKSRGGVPMSEVPLHREAPESGTRVAGARGLGGTGQSGKGEGRCREHRKGRCRDSRTEHSRGAHGLAHPRAYWGS